VGHSENPDRLGMVAAELVVRASPAVVRVANAED
jgi:hypothetical protein